MEPLTQITESDGLVNSWLWSAIFAWTFDPSHPAFISDSHKRCPWNILWSRISLPYPHLYSYWSLKFHLAWSNLMGHILYDTFRMEVTSMQQLWRWVLCKRFLNVVPQYLSSKHSTKNYCIYLHIWKQMDCYFVFKYSQTVKLDKNNRSLIFQIRIMYLILGWGKMGPQKMLNIKLAIVGANTEPRAVCGYCKNKS